NKTRCLLQKPGEFSCHHGLCIAPASWIATMQTGRIVCSRRAGVAELDGKTYPCPVAQHTAIGIARHLQEQAQTRVFSAQAAQVRRDTGHPCTTVALALAAFASSDACAAACAAAAPADVAGEPGPASAHRRTASGGGCSSADGGYTASATTPLVN